MKKNLIIIIENIIVGLIKLFFIAIFALAANLDDYVIPITEFQRTTTEATGILLAISCDIIFTFITYNILKKKVTYKRLLAISLLITLIEIILVI